MNETTDEAARDAILGIDGALGPFSVALVSASDAFAPRALAGLGNDALERGLELLRQLLDGRHPASLARIVVTTGPGSFTGLRIAAAYAKSLAFACGVPLVALDSFDAIEPEGDGFALAAIASRTGRVNARLRLPGGERVVRTGTFAEVARSVAADVPPGTTLAVAGPAAGVREALAEHRIHVVSVNLPMPIALAVATRGRQRRPLESAHALVANYGEGAYGAQEPAGAP